MTNHITPWQERLHALSTQDEIDAAIAAEIAELRTKLAEAQADAARYRWLRDASK